MPKIGEMDGNGTIPRRDDATVSYFHQDHLTSTSVISDDEGDTTGSKAFYPFGAVRASSGTFPTDKLFTGQRTNNQVLYYYGARFYDTAVRMFISPDTIIPNPANPQSFNRYSYVLNNPLKYVDPDGHDDVDWYLAAIHYAEQGKTIPSTVVDRVTKTPRAIVLGSTNTSNLGLVFASAYREVVFEDEANNLMIKYAESGIAQGFYRIESSVDQVLNQKNYGEYTSRYSYSEMANINHAIFDSPYLQTSVLSSEVFLTSVEVPDANWSLCTDGTIIPTMRTDKVLGPEDTLVAYVPLIVPGPNVYIGIIISGPGSLKSGNDWLGLPGL